VVGALKSPRRLPSGRGACKTRGSYLDCGARESLSAAASIRTSMLQHCVVLAPDQFMHSMAAPAALPGVLRSTCLSNVCLRSPTDGVRVCNR
jgi:hypothetical protein